MADDKIRDKIRALLAKTRPGSGATEEEAATAMNLAAAMMMKYGIQVALDDLEHEPAGWSGATERNDYLKWHLFCAEAASYLYHVKPFVWNGRDGYAFEFIGRPEHTDAAKQTFLWLVDQVEALYKQNLPRGLSKSLRAELRRTFKLACAARIRGRAWRMMEELTSKDTVAIASTGSTALVVKSFAVAMLNEAQEAMDAKFPKEKRKQMTVRKSKSGVGTQIGLLAGDSVKLHKDVGVKRVQLEHKR